MKNEKKLIPFFIQLKEKIKNNDFVIDKTGVKTVELIAPRLELNPIQNILNFGIRKTPIEYCEREIKWYNSCNLNIKNYVDDVKLWRDVSDSEGNIISNYGWMIYSSQNFYQYKHVINELKNNKESRRALMIYQRPSMWLEYNLDGKSDFCCTNSVQCMIRNNKLEYIISQRSLDIWYSLIGMDLYWHGIVYKKLYNELKKYYKNLKIGSLIWIPGSMHLYEKHFDKFIKLVNEYGEKHE